MAKSYEELTFTDDFLFCKIMESRPDLCKELLELILDKKLGRLVEVNRQKPIEITADGKGVRFDVYAEDDENVIYDVEMQNASEASLPKRVRYSQGMIDLNLIERGRHYEELNRSYIIYICDFNLFKHGRRHKYSFANLCREDTAIELGDETEKIFLCAKGKMDDVSENMKAFLEYITKGVPGNKLTDMIDQEVQEAKVHRRWRAEYMTLLEHYEKERKEGLEEGLEKGILGAVDIMHLVGKTEAEMTDLLVDTYKINFEKAQEYINEWKNKRSDN